MSHVPDCEAVSEKLLAVAVYMELHSGLPALSGRLMRNQGARSSPTQESIRMTLDEAAMATTGAYLKAELVLALHEGHAVPQSSAAALAVGSQPHIVVCHDCTEMSGRSLEWEAYWCRRHSPRREGSTDTGAASSARGSRSLRWCEPGTEQDSTGAPPGR